MALVNALSTDSGVGGLTAPVPTGLGVTGIWKGIAPEQAVHPVVTFHDYAPSADESTLSIARAWTTYRYVIKGIGKGIETQGQIEEISERLLWLLTDPVLSIAGHVLMYCRRESELSYTETSGGTVFQHAGGVFRLEVE